MSSAKQKSHPAHVASEELATEVVDTFLNIGELSNAGVNVADIDKLRQAGIHTIGSIFQRPTKALLEIRGFSDAKVSKILDAARKLDSNSSSSFKTGLDVRDRRKNVIHITTGAKSVDAILGGGIETGSISEFYGEFRTGKTQLMHTLAVTTQIDRQSGGGAGRVVYIDTENNFRPERCTAVAGRYGLDSDEVLDNIMICIPQSHEAQMDCVAAVGALCITDGPIRLLIIDSIITLFRTDFSGRGELSERQQKLNKHLVSLKNLATEFNLAVVLVNQVMSDPGAMSMFATVKPVGGHVMSHASTTRVMLKKGRGEERIAKICDSPLMPEAEAIFKISDGGVCDSE
mmetsp:Transcript_16009/g.23748  ORF Transcript_16009/g.23748 Transcript_16009/m.23748 type:complete len:345 (+) Transcript_16009:104-1138(+)